MKTDRELLAISRRIRSGKIALDDIGDLTREDLGRLERLGEERLALHVEITQIVGQMMAHLESHPESQSVGDVLLHYRRTGQREQYQALFDLLTRAEELSAQEQKWEELEGASQSTDA